MKTSGKKIYQQDDITIIHIHYNKIAQPYQRLVRLGFLYAYASEIKNSYHHHHHPWFTGKGLLKVSKFQNEFMKSSFLPKYEPKIVRISAL